MSRMQKIMTKLAIGGDSLLNNLPGAHWEDGDFMHDARAATLRGAHPAAYLLLWAVCGIVLVFILWAAFAKLDEVTRGEGKVIPSSRVQIVQNLEGGIVEEIRVQEGALVEKGELLMRIDDTGFSSSLAEKQTRAEALEAAIIRLQAELAGKKPSFPTELSKKAPDIVKEAQQLFASRQKELKSSLNILKNQHEQKEQELKESKKRLSQAQRSFALAKKELDITAPLEKEGVVSKVEVLRLMRQVSDLKGEQDAAELSVPRAAAALKESKNRLNEARNKWANEVQAELTEKKEELKRLQDVSKAVADQVDRTNVKSPVKGVVKSVLVNTVGGVVQPGMDLVELIPLEDNLLVEAQVRPADIAFIRPGLDATVKLTAYDFSIYGGLPAKLERISADTFTDDRGETFYTIRVRTEKNYLESGGKRLPIIPGMVAQVDILTGKKSVLDYLLKPFLKARENALRER